MTAWRDQLLGDLFEIDSTPCYPSKTPSRLFRHLSIPAWDATGGPALESGATIDSNKLHFGRRCVVVSKLNPRIPRVMLLDPATFAEPVCASTELIAYCPKSSSTPLEFFKHYFASERLRWMFGRIATGTTNSHVRLRPQDTLRWSLRLPTTDEQVRIAEILDAVEVACERCREALDRARRFRLALLQMLVTRGIGTNGRIRDRASDPFQPTAIGWLPAGWDISRLDGVAEVGSGITLGKDLTGQATVELPYLRVANVQAGYIDLTEIKTVKVRPQEVSDYALEPGDVLMTEGGDIDKLGRGAVWRGSLEPCLHQNHIFRVRARRDRLDPRFLEAVICADLGRRYFFRIAKRTTNLASINKTQLRAFTIPLPPIQEQNQIAEVLDQAQSYVDSVAVKVEVHERLKRGLMQDLLTGGVRVPESLKAGAS